MVMQLEKRTQSVRKHYQTEVLVLPRNKLQERGRERETERERERIKDKGGEKVKLRYDLYL